MRLNAQCFAVSMATCGLVWVALMVVYTRLEGQDARTPRDDRQALWIARLQQLEKSVEEELKQNGVLLKQLRNRLETKKHPTEVVNSNTTGPLVLPVLVMACNRVSVRRCLDKLIRYRPSVVTFPIIVSQDCNHKPTHEVIQNFTKRSPGVSHIVNPNREQIPLSAQQMKYQGYYRISRHYNFALSYVLDHLKYESVIIVEDDLDISVDFFEYFLGTYPLLKEDPTLWCISAWNDNGKRDLIDLSRPELLHRTDFFPGLGWLLPARHWRRFKHKWPPAFFDDWLREPAQTGGLSCIRPEISRTSTFGKEGVSKGLFFDMHLRYIKLNEKFVPFTRLDLDYLLKKKYDHRQSAIINATTLMTVNEVKNGVKPKAVTVRVTYTDQHSFKKIAKSLGLMDDFRSGVARTAYRGVVTCFYRNRRVYITPAKAFVGYQTKRPS